LSSGSSLGENGHSKTSSRGNKLVRQFVLGWCGSWCGSCTAAPLRGGERAAVQLPLEQPGYCRANNGKTAARTTAKIKVVFMYAIITDGGRQYKVEEGQELTVDFRDIPKGEQLKFDNVVAVSDEDGLKLGEPTLDGASVTAEVLGVELGKRLAVHKLRRRKNSRRKTGHRQMYTKVRISKIEA
jgi:large subunit ribosomal protein L21